MTDPTPSCSEIARKIAFESSAKHGYEEASLRGWQEEQITEALQAKQKEIEELQAKLESCEMLSGSTMGRICCQYHRAEALEKELESLRAEVEETKIKLSADFLYKDLAKRVFGRIFEHGREGQHDIELALMEIIQERESLKAQLSRLKEILKGRDEALMRARFTFTQINFNAQVGVSKEWLMSSSQCGLDVIDQALSKTWEEGEK